MKPRIKKPLVVCITGAAGQIGYALIPLVASGDVFGYDQPVELRLLDIAPQIELLKGTVMEIHDGAYPLVVDVKCGFDPREMFKDMDIGLFVGGFPRKEGMERKELMAKNCGIFKEQGQALNDVAKPTARILVVANPANTNCLVLSKFAPNIPKENFSCLTRLDHNRTLAQLAEKAKVPLPAVKNVIIWGNHSSTQFPDTNYAVIDNKPATDVIADANFLKDELVTVVQKRGAAIIKARKASSAMSAAKAIRDHMRSWYFGTDEWTSMGVIAKGNPYGIDEDLCFSFPCRCTGGFEYKVVGGLLFDDKGKERIKATELELVEERKEALGL